MIFFSSTSNKTVLSFRHLFLCFTFYFYLFTMQSTVLPSKGANVHIIDPSVTYLAYKRQRCRADLSPGQTDFQVKSTPICKTRTSVSTNLRWVAKHIRKSALKFTQVVKSLHFTHIQLTCRSSFMATCVGCYPACQRFSKRRRAVKRR